jgi:hypothetical protein
VAVPASFGATPVAVVDAGGGEASSSVATMPADSPGTRRASGGRRLAGVVLGAAGLGALVVGASFGLRASSLWDQRNQACPMERCTAEGLSLGQRADAAATVSTWTFAAGAVSVGAAAVLLLWPARREASGTAIARVLRNIGQNIGIDGQGRVIVGGRF